MPIKPLQNHNKAVIYWLYACAGMVLAMIIIGAITRLTESGLSMVEWRPLIGALPPMNEQEWNRVFEAYQATPEFQKKNFWMELGDFKTIFFWEWFHRLWGRLIGVVFALPLLFFWLRGMIPSGYHLKFLGLLILGGLQGLMGWYMVKSGLIDNPAVSHFRLAAHLSLAFLILSLLLLCAFSLHIPKGKHTDKPSYLWGLATLAVISVTILWGAYTAGLDGGLIYNSWPKMGDSFIPAEIQNQNALSSIIHTPAGVQFAHRWLAIIAALTTLSLRAFTTKRGVSFTALHALAGMVLLQVILGITTLLSGVNIILATLHQTGASILIGLLMLCLYQLKPLKNQD